MTRPDEILKPNQNQILSTVLPTNNVRQVLPIQQQPPQRYPSSTASSNPGSLSSSAGGTSALTTASNKNFSSLNHNYSTSNHSNPHSQPRNSFGIGYSPYSTKSSGFKTSAERGLPRDRDREIEGTPERDPNVAAASSSSRIVEGEGTGDSAGVFSFSSPYFGPQSIADEDIDLEQDGSSRNQAGEEMKSPGWAAITLGQLSLGSPDVSSLSTTPYSTSISNQNSGSIPKSSTMMSLSSSQGGGASSSSSRRYPPNSSSANNSSRPNSSRVHGPSSFNSGSPASRSLPSADAAIHAAAMHRRASYNRTASGAQRPSLIQSSSQHHSSLGLSPASPSPIGMATHAGRPRQSGGVGNRRKNERSRSRNRYTSKGRNPATSNRDVEFDEDATDDDEMVLDINDKDHNHLVDDDDDTEDELLDHDHSGSIAGSNIESSVIGEMDTDLEMDESEMGSNYGGGDNKRMKDSNVNGWDIHSRDNASNVSRSLSGYYTSTRGEYVSSSNGSNGISIGNNNKNGSNQSGISRPYLLDRVNKSSSSGTSPSLGLSLGHGLDSHSPRNNTGGSSSFGTSPSSFGRHHPYASTSRSNSNFGNSHQSASPSRNQSGMSNHHHSSRSTSSINNDLDVGSNSLPTRMGIGVSPLGKTSVSKKNKNEDSMAIEDDDDTDDEIFDDDEMEEDLRNKVKGLTVGSQNNTKSTLSSSSNARPIRKSNTIRRTSFQSDYDYGTGLSSSLTNKSTATLKDLESIISSSPKKSNTKSSGSNGNGNGEKSTASISAAGIREKLGGSSNCSAFISKLWHLMSNPDKYQDYITWSTSGDSIILYNDQDRQDVFAKEILPKLFKHGNVASFVRQLNVSINFSSFRILFYGQIFFFVLLKVNFLPSLRNVFFLLQLYGFQRVPTSRSLDSAEQEVAISQASNSSNSNPSSRGGRPKLSSIATSAGAFYGSHSAFVHPNFMRGGEDRLPSMKPRSSKGKKVKDDVGDISTSPSNASLINNGEKKSKTNGRKVENSKVVVNDLEEETDDEEDLAFD